MNKNELKYLKKIFNSNIEDQMNNNNVIKKLLSKNDDNNIIKTIEKMYEYSNKEYNGRKNLFKKNMETCRKNDECKKLFINNNVKFLIIELKNEITELYSLIIKDSNKGVLVHFIYS